MADNLEKFDADSEATKDAVVFDAATEVQKIDTRQRLLDEQRPDQPHLGPVPISSSSSSSTGPFSNLQILPVVDGPVVVPEEIIREQADDECVENAFIREMNVDLLQSLKTDPATFCADCFVFSVMYDILGDSSPASNLDGGAFSAKRTIVCGKAVSLYSVCEYVQGLLINDPDEISTVVTSESTRQTSSASLHLWGFCCGIQIPGTPSITWKIMDLRDTAERFLGIYPDYDKLQTVNPLHAYPMLYGLTFQKNVFAQMGMCWSRLVPLSLEAICVELDQVRSQVRSCVFPEGCTLSDVRFLTHVRSQNLAQTNSVPVKVDLTAATYPIRALNVETAPPPLKKQCLYVRDEQWFRPIHLESGNAIELYEL